MKREDVAKELTQAVWTAAGGDLNLIDSGRLVDAALERLDSLGMVVVPKSDSITYRTYCE